MLELVTSPPVTIFLERWCPAEKMIKLLDNDKEDKLEFIELDSSPMLYFVSKKICHPCQISQMGNIMTIKHPWNFLS